MFRRFYHVSSIAYSFKKQGMKLSKMLIPKSAKRKWQITYDTLPTTKSLSKTSQEPGKRGIRRIAVLNKLFMKNITDLMSTGSFALDVLGRGIEISKVKVTPDYEMLNVYWVCKGTVNDIETEKILNRNAGPLRHELSALRLMGEVPYIIFIKDRQEAQIFDLDKRLAHADYGEDYEPTELGHLLKTEFSLDTKLSPEMKAKIKALESNDNELPLEEDPIPEMTHTVYGLEHSKIMNRLLASRKMNQDAWSRIDGDNNVVSYRMTDGEPSHIDNASQRQELADFLHKRQILENKIHKELRQLRSEPQVVVEDEINEDDDVDDDYNDDEDDYYSDDDYLPATKADSDKNESDNR